MRRRGRTVPGGLGRAQDRAARRPSRGRADRRVCRRHRSLIKLHDAIANNHCAPREGAFPPVS
ncbi:hypothetical protein BCEP4_160005 [Burkholderia cepacia]|nr:hypothetical protein BCEP4_160005 [Burkholderia cepacia]